MKVKHDNKVLDKMNNVRNTGHITHTVSIVDMTPHITVVLRS